MNTEETKDLNPFLRIKICDTEDKVLFYSSDPFEIGKHKLNGLGLDCIIVLYEIKYIVKDLKISFFSSEMDYRYGIDYDIESYIGREIPFICDIKLIVKIL